MEQEQQSQYEKKSFVSVFDIPSNEAWLEDEARNGLRVVSVTAGGRVKFEHTEPFSCRYRLQPSPKGKGKPPEDQIELYHAMGWDYVGTTQGYLHLWRCEDPDARELDTDPVAQAEGYRRIVRSLLRTDAALLGTDLAFLAFILYQLFSGGPYYFVRYTVPGYLIVVALYLVVGGLVGVLESRGMIRMVKQLRSGIPLERSEDYWKKRLLIQGFSVVLFVFILWNNGLFGLVSPEPKVAYAETGAMPVAQAIYPSLAQLEGVPEEQVSFFRPKVKRHELAPEMWFITQSADHEDQTQSQLVTDYYRMTGTFLVPKMEERLLEHYRERDDVGELAPVESGALDRFWWTECIAHDRREQYGVAVLGNRILAVGYHGQADLREHTDLLAQCMEK